MLHSRGAGQLRTWIAHSTSRGAELRRSLFPRHIANRGRGPNCRRQRCANRLFVSLLLFRENKQQAKKGHVVALLLEMRYHVLHIALSRTYDGAPDGPYVRLQDPLTFPEEERVTTVEYTPVCVYVRLGLTTDIA